ncbi:MAG: LAGLIDADG family homing endonuclease [Nanoarchaeota archaeon]|nr:LAGLIDADG family homing endonuclease [Nanoarchaeota archaeon]
MKKLILPKNKLKKLYLEKGFTTFQIAKKLDCCQATIWKRLKELNIKSRLPGVKRVNISKKKLNELYLKKKLSTWKIEKETGIPRSTIHRKLREFNLPTRNLATANTLYPKKDFNGDLLEKAYLIGFRIGDLRVRKPNKGGKTICVACGTTIPEQILLIKQLFEKYGRVWVKKTKIGKINIEAFLNTSFEFLLGKEIPPKILENRKLFFSFLAGFIDAEGSIKVYRNMARFSLGNYDKNTLIKIYQCLNKFNIECKKPLVDKRKGKRNNEGYKYNSNYWHFGINKKEELLKFLSEISPYIKHKNKIKDLNIAIENIKLRSMKNG